MVLMLTIGVEAWTGPVDPASQRSRGGERLAGRWIGQDGHDYVGPSSEAKPSGIQDVRIELVGLPAGEEIGSILVRGHGGDEWQYNAGSSYRAHLERQPGSTRANLYIEPTRVETGRSFEITLTLKDGRSAVLYVQGGAADPTRRMPGAKLAARWLGQDGRDRVGPTAAVGPDGWADLILELDNLTSGEEIQAIEMISGTNRWAVGTNPWAVASAELVRDANNRSKAWVFLAPIGLEPGAAIDLRVLYGNKTHDTARVRVGPFDPRLAASKPKVPRVDPIRLTTRSLGQDGPEGPQPGLVRLAVSGITRPVTAAVLANRVGAVWGWSSRADDLRDGGSDLRPLDWQSSGDGRSAVLGFAPIRNEESSPLSLRLIHADGSHSVAELDGPACDPAQRAPRPGANQATAAPGDDLSELVRHGGTLRLNPGIYRLDRPLVLEQPIAIVGQPGAILEFHQDQAAPAWTEAIQIEAGNTRLEGVAIRFAGPVRWDWNVPHGPAIIGTPADQAPRHWGNIRAGIGLIRLEIESPPAASDWELAPHAMRLMTAASGEVRGCRIRGGSIELTGGPWQVVDNEHLGTPPQTFAYAIISAKYVHDLTIARNRARAVGPSGKVWRFLVLTQRASNVEVRENTVRDVGPRAGDRVDENAPEIILTEAYRLRFEGRPVAVAGGGSVIVIPEPQGDPGEPGDVLAVVAGRHAGTYRRVVQRIDRFSYLLDEPLPTADAAELPAVSLGAGGFVNCRFEQNEIDGGEQSRATGFVLVGHHYGTLVRGNRVRRCAQAFKITAFPTEQPVFWGWSHAPILGIEIRENRAEACAQPSWLAVEHGEPVKSNVGRVYWTGTLDDLTSDPGWTIGDRRSRDPGELHVQVHGATRYRVEAGTVNGRRTPAATDARRRVQADRRP
jgi:hypothetical protein